MEALDGSGSSSGCLSRLGKEWRNIWKYDRVDRSWEHARPTVVLGFMNNDKYSIVSFHLTIYITCIILLKSK